MTSRIAARPVALAYLQSHHNHEKIPTPKIAIHHQYHYNHRTSMRSAQVYFAAAYLKLKQCDATQRNYRMRRNPQSVVTLCCEPFTRLTPMSVSLCFHCFRVNCYELLVEVAQFIAVLKICIIDPNCVNCIMFKQKLSNNSQGTWRAKVTPSRTSSLCLAFRRKDFVAYEGNHPK